MNSQIQYFALFTWLFLSIAVGPISGQSDNGRRSLDIVYIGNSITRGSHLEDPKKDAPPAVASQFIQSTKGFDVRFNNQGRGGATTVDYLPERKTYYSQVLEAVGEFHVDPARELIFSISLGTNDSAEEGPTGSPVDPLDYEKNLTLIINALLTEFPSSIVILQQPIWYSENTYNSSRYMAEGLARLRSYFPKLKSVVKNYAKVEPGKVFMGDVKGYRYFKKNYLTDHVPESGQAGTFYLHPNEKGAIVLGEFWAKSIAKCLR